jgi:nucleotide-binding universal stress UspA family protein
MLIAYDGSANADHAIQVAAGLFGAGTAELIHAWEPVSSAAVRSAIYAVTFDDSPELLRRERQQAAAVAERGLKRCREAGFKVTGGAISGSGPLWAVILERAEAIEPRSIVMGTRGLSGLRSTLAGSVSRSVTSHSRFPVLTVPMAIADGTAKSSSPE